MNGNRDAIEPDGGFYHSLCEHAPAAMIATDPELKVILWNAAATKLFDRSANQMIGRPLTAIVAKKRRSVLGKLLRRVLRDGAIREFEVEHPGPGGQILSLLAVIGPIPGTNQRGQGVAAWVRNVTIRTRMAERLAAAEKMASLGTLAGGVAHHFNNILGGVATFVDYALTTNDPAASRRALQMTAEATARVAKLTQSLLSFAEQDPRRADLADFTETILTFVHLVERPLAERNIVLTLDLHPVPIVAVEANRMHHILGNLLTNAEEAMPDGGEIRLAIGGSDQWVWLDFADTGRGISPEHLPMVFEPFFTTKGLLAGGSAGNPGLGLSVVHGIVTELGGEISVDSARGEGACFQLRFPKPTENGA